MPDEKPFQLDPSHLKTGNFIIDSFLKNAIKDINKADLNKNGVADISEFAPIVFNILPLLVALNAAVDFEAIAHQLSENPAIKDKEVFKHVLLELGKLLENAGKVLPH